MIYELSNGMTESNVFHGHRNEYVCCRFRAAEAGLDRGSVVLEIGDYAQAVVFLTDLGEGCWQANARLPAGLQPGVHRVRVRTLRMSSFSASCDAAFDAAFNDVVRPLRGVGRPGRSRL